MIKAEQIHKDFKSALDMSSIKSDVLKKEVALLATSFPNNRETLASLGLTSSKNYSTEMSLVSTINQTKKEIELAKTLLEIEAKYPQYRIISLNKIFSLLEKYNLCLGYIRDYTASIPEKNLKELAEYDQTVACTVGRRVSIEEMIGVKKYCSDSYLIVAPQHFFKDSLRNIGGLMLHGFDNPKFKFDLGEKAPVPDPIVLRALNVKCDHDDFFHIATAWDVEAEDELVTTKVL